MVIGSDAAAIVLVSGGGGENMLEKRYRRNKKYTFKGKITTRKMKRTSRYSLPGSHQ